MDAINREYQKLRLDYVRSADQSAAHPVHHPIIAVGAGPVGVSWTVDRRGKKTPLRG